MSGFMYAFDAGAGRAETVVPALVDLGDKLQVRKSRSVFNLEQVALVAVDGPHTPLVGYKEDAQTWKKAHDGDYWIGWYNEAPPEPEQLRKDEGLAGHKVTLGDGNEWEVPVARAIDPKYAMPKALSYDEHGNLQLEVEDKFQSLWSIGQRAWASLEIDQEGATEGEPFMHEDGIPVVSTLLGVNYHVGPAEVSALKLVTTHNFDAVLCAVVDLPSLNKMTEKKTES